MSKTLDDHRGAVAGPVDWPVRRLYVYEIDRNHVRIDCKGSDIYVSTVFSGRSYSISTNVDGAALLKKALSAVLNDAGA